MRSDVALVQFNGHFLRQASFSDVTKLGFTPQTETISK